MPFLLEALLIGSRVDDPPLNLDQSPPVSDGEYGPPPQPHTGLVLNLAGTMQLCHVAQEFFHLDTEQPGFTRVKSTTVAQAFRGLRW